jgi:hypothetical protein
MFTSFTLSFHIFHFHLLASTNFPIESVYLKQDAGKKENLILLVCAVD